MSHSAITSVFLNNCIHEIFAAVRLDNPKAIKNQIPKCPALLRNLILPPLRNKPWFDIIL